MLNTLSKILIFLLLTSYTSVFPLVADEIKDQKIIQLERLLKVYIEENNAKGQAEYFKTRGKADDLTNYSLIILKQYGGF